MGVTGLLPQLKEIQTPNNLLEYKGKTLAIDTYSWLHKAIVSCAQELCQNKPTQKYITSVLKKVEMLRHFGVEPYLVFDGASLPTKAATAAERRARREEAQKKADEYMAKGNRLLAWKEFMKAAGVTSQMAKSIMVELDKRNIKYVVAPYEADPQMVYLEKIGLVDGIISEDSDLLVFGCKQLITKLNEYGECIVIKKEDFGQLTSMKGIDDFEYLQLRLLAMLSGCDYTKGIPGVGIKTAFNLIKKYQTAERVLMGLRAEGKKVPDGFEEELLKADLAFQYQKVFNPRTQTLETLNPYPEDFRYDMEMVEQCCGLTQDPEVHAGICNGKLHPNTFEALISREQNLSMLKSKSVTITTNTKTTFTKTTGKIDSFFTAKKSTSLVTSNYKVDQTKERKQSEIRNFNDPKVSPMHKKTKKVLELPQETPKLTGKFSKFFKTSPTVVSPSILETPQASADITGDSDIPESSPVAHRSQTHVDTKNLLDNLTDDDEAFQDSEDIVDSLPQETSNSIKHVSKSPNRGLAEFDIDEDDDIEESPVKHRVDGNKEKVKKMLWDNFLFNPDKFDMDKSFSSSFSSERSFDLKSDDLLEKDKENIFTSESVSIKQTANVSSKGSISKSTKTSISRTLSKFAYSP